MGSEIESIPLVGLKFKEFNFKENGRKYRLK